MRRDPGSKPVEEGEVGVGQVRRLGADAGAGQAAYAGTPQAPGVAPEREGQTPLPPERGRPGEAGARPEPAPEPRGTDEGEPHERVRP
jgi:hypothetical protein